MNRGDVLEYTLGNSRVTILIVSATVCNPRTATYVLVLGPSAAPPPRRAIRLVATGTADPARGTVDVSRLRPLVADNVGARVGRMSRTTMTAVDEALRTYLDL